MTDEQQLRQKLMGQRIRAARNTAGLDQRALAELASMTQGAIGNYESGSRVPRWDELRRLATALDRPGTWIIEPLVMPFDDLAGN